MLKLSKRALPFVGSPDYSEVVASIKREPADKPLIMGTVAKYSPDKLRPFLSSLQETGYDGHIVLFVRRLPEETAQFLKEQRVLLVQMTHKYLLHHMMNYRFFFYLEFLREARKSGVNFPGILITDIRDVIFQSDPFKEPIGFVEFFEEHPIPTIGTCRFNSKWIKELFGDAVFDELKDEVVCCAGTTIGTMEGILTYLTEMKRILGPLGVKRRRHNLDQGAHNYIARRHLIAGARIEKNGSRVLTVANVPRDQISADSNHRIVDGNGSVSPIVHQFDRHDGLTAAVETIANL